MSKDGEDDDADDVAGFDEGEERHGADEADANAGQIDAQSSVAVGEIGEGRDRDDAETTDEESDVDAIGRSRPSRWSNPTGRTGDESGMVSTR